MKPEQLMLEAAHTIVVITSRKRRTTTRSWSRPRAPTRPHQAGHVLQRKLTVSLCVASFLPPLLPSVVVSKDHHNNLDRIWKKEIRGRGRKKNQEAKGKNRNGGRKVSFICSMPRKTMVSVHIALALGQLNTRYM